MNLSHPSKYLRFKAFDTTTEQGRADERYRLALFAMGANFLSRAISLVVMILTVSLTIPYLGAERFGVWMTIASLAGMLTFLDLGVGNALTNKVADAATKRNPVQLADTISGGLGVLLLLSIAMIFILNGLSFVVPWHVLIKTSDEATRTEIQHAVHVFSVLFAFTIFTTGVQRVFHGLQRGFEAHFTAIAGSLLSLIALWMVAKQEANISWLLASAMGGPIIANLILVIRLIKRSQFTLAGIGRNIRLEAHHLIKVGGLFFLLQLGTMVGWGADSLIISSTLGATSVAVFNVTQRLFQFASQPLSIVNAPLWPAFADAHSHGDKAFIRKTLKKALIGSVIFGFLISATMLSMGEFLIEKWTAGLVQVPFVFLAIYAVWVVLDVLANAFAMFMNGCNVVKPQVFGVIALVIISVPLKYFLILNFGIEAMLAGFVLFFIVNLAFWYGFVYRQEIRNALI